MKKVLLAHGGGGEQTWRIIKEVFLKNFKSEKIKTLEDATPVETSGKIAVTTDCFTVSPLFFNGGDIGKLAVAGTVNDLAVMGARPLYMTAGFIIEEGFPLEDLIRIVRSMAEEAERSGIEIIAGDTKVVPSGSADGVFIAASGIGEIIYEGLSSTAIQPGDVILVSGTIGDHGACILAQREGLEMDVDLKSDCSGIWDLVKTLLDAGIEVHAMRDPTRGGLSAVLYEWAHSSGINFLIEEENIPVKDSVIGLCEFLGIEPYHLASEGKVIIAVKGEDGEKALKILRDHPLGKEAQIIGRAMEKSNFPKVIIRTRIGTERILDPPSGEILPRIC